MATNTTPGYIDEENYEYLEANVTTPDYKINYGDDRFTQVEADKDAAISEMEGTYDQMIGQSDKYYQDQIDAAKEWGDKQAQLQQEQTDFAIEQIEQQKDQANKDYIKEQSGAYQDWQKQSNAYGVSAEKQAAAGLAGTGYSESAQVSMYNTYQNRIATARESYNQAVLNYNNAIKDARLQNNSILAEIAYNSLQTQLQLALQGFQYKNTLVLDKLNTKIELDNQYYQRYQDVLTQMNTENAMAEQIRQYNETAQRDIEKWNKEQEFNIHKFNEETRQEQQEYDRKVAKDKADAEAEADRLEEEQRQFDKTFEAMYGDGGNGGGGGNTPITGNDSSPTQQSAEISEKTDGTYIKTDYFKGVLPARTASAIQEFGVFANGYQPMGIHGAGKVTKTGFTIPVNTVTLSGEKRTVNQNVWKTPDGSYWYWEGRKMTYIKLDKSTILGNSGGGGGGSTNTYKVVK